MIQKIDYLSSMNMLTFLYFWLYFFMAIYAVIVAAGKGKRFGGFKQFVNFQGKPLLIHTAKIFERNSLVDSIIIVAPGKMLKRAEELIKKYRVTKVYSVVPGGKRRQDSVFKGIKAVKDKSGIAIIHDAVRPFVSQNLINRGIKLCRKYKAVIFGTPIFDTVKLVRRNKVVETIPRISPYAIQTPQFFDFECLMSAYRNVDLKKIEFTDEAAIVESAGLPVFVFRGESENRKITTRHDLKILGRAK